MSYKEFEDDEYEYPTITEINEMRAEYLKEKDVQEAKAYVDHERESMLAYADYLRDRAKYDN